MREASMTEVAQNHMQRLVGNAARSEAAMLIQVRQQGGSAGQPISQQRSVLNLTAGSSNNQPSGDASSEMRTTHHWRVSSLGNLEGLMTLLSQLAPPYAIAKARMKKFTTHGID
jgi:hypothetical protein